MAERVPKGTWVELHRIVLAPGKRAPGVPEETARVPLEMTVKGFLTRDAAPGEATEIVTRAGRRLHGTLQRVNPPYTHGFGPPIPELQSAGEELRALLGEPGDEG
jgi:hypothetical protein